MYNKVVHQKGFSLVEIIIAIAILGLVVVTICGVFLHGLNSIKKSKYKACAIHIANQKFSEIQDSDWSYPSGLPADRLSQAGLIEGFQYYSDPSDNGSFIDWNYGTSVAVYGTQSMGGIDYDYTISIDPNQPYVKKVSVLLEWEEIKGHRQLKLSTLMARRY